MFIRSPNNFPPSLICCFSLSHFVRALAVPTFPRLILRSLPPQKPSDLWIEASVLVIHYPSIDRKFSRRFRLWFLHRIRVLGSDSASGDCISGFAPGSAVSLCFPCVWSDRDLWPAGRQLGTDRDSSWRIPSSCRRITCRFPRRDHLFSLMMSTTGSTGCRGPMTRW